ncbi:hypothetical protein M9980_09135 [Sphingomonas donggukensis]|uniref:Lipoprotein n=1 Tax=Sphingomonas donggukensis TaxID=2949093 RepID=A0ABY4TQT2_9SPHN|nr:hypothetical protein [Sphingomonas donggukensis]URW74738.1 hypothetical protein M9980_09135 [Sphingomonas donggukensis]
MKTLPLLALAATLAGCSSQPPVANNVSAVEVNGTEEVAIAEGDVVPDVDEAANASVANTAGPADTAPTEAAYLGRWIGVEGMYLNVARKAGGGVTLDMQWDLDNKGKFDGSVTAEGLRFMRNGTAETAAFTDGDATGLKYLAGKKTCLTVKSGEGYCRN